MADWYRCVSCHADLRSCRHTNTCPMVTIQKQGEIGRVRSIVATYTGMKPRKGFMVIEGGKAHKEEEGQSVDS